MGGNGRGTKARKCSLVGLMTRKCFFLFLTAMFPIKSLCVALLLLTCCGLAAQNEEHRVRNVVLVHGAWADASGWKGVYDILAKYGYKVSIVQEPETSFQ